MCSTSSEFDKALTACGDIFEKKLKDYGASWRILHPASVTDQMFIKAKRIRTLLTTGKNLVGDSVLGEFIALVNYAAVALIQLELGASDHKDLTANKAMDLYRAKINDARALMEKKNHDYGEAWRDMRVLSYADFILTKIERIKEIEDNAGKTLVSEGIESNCHDILNYAVFGVIKSRC